MITVLPLNLFFYAIWLFVGLYFMTTRRIRYGGKILSCFLFAFLSIWVSNDNLLDTEVWYTTNYNSTSGNYTITHTVQDITTPYNILFIAVNVVLAILSIALLIDTVTREEIE